MDTRLIRTVLWQRLDVPGCERFDLAREGDGWRLSGTVLAVGADEPAQLTYRIALDRDWSTRDVLIDYRFGAEERERRLRLAVDEEQRWHVVREPADGSGASLAEVPEFRGLVDVDLGYTPATNTLPIHRLNPAVGEAVEVTAAWISYPELTLEPLPQRYLRLGERRYRYESSGGAFTATLEVDDLGLMVRYEGLFQRVAEADSER